MPSIHVSGIPDDLESDLKKIPVEARARMRKVVRKNVRQGRLGAQEAARRASGPHGLNYWKRITDEMTGPLEGEYGPEGDVEGRAVGAGYRNGNTNTDLEKSLDIQGPRFERDVQSILNGLFWPS